MTPSRVAKLSHQNPDIAPLYGCEVLVRWQHPTLGLLNPDLFIPYAEDAGLVQLIDYYVLDSACQQARIWHQAGWNISVSVNLSGLHFRNTTIADKIEKALRTSNLPPHLLNIELTEAVLISDNAIATKVVSQIKMLGVKVSLDDFGVGYSSLNYLRTLPFDVIKLDKSFVSSILSQPQDKKLTEGIIKLASSLDLTVVAEGIETLEHAEVLFKLGCTHMQGYYFSRPLNKADFESWHFKRLELRND
jgi:diguanylate cyclase